MNRRNFLAWIAAALSSCSGTQRSITGSIVGASHDVGHLLRGGVIPPVSGEERIAVAIVGGGISGLSAGWWLRRNRVEDFRIFELESHTGGNSSSGSNAVSAYPWGAHYVPLPTKESRWVRELFEELGVIDGHDAAGEPTYKEQYLCAAPQERLYLHGRWQEGLVPTIGATQNDLDEFDRFHSLVRTYRERRDRDQRKAFSIPMEFSSREPDLLELDQISMARFLDDRGFHSPLLHWYVNYGCRDDFGCLHSDVSAWAGMHYFASRDAAMDEQVLTWPEGNGWIVRRLEEKLSRHIANSSVVFRIEQSGGNVVVDLYQAAEKRSIRVIAEHLIFACPTFLAKYIVSGTDDLHDSLKQFEYAPWLVANITLDGFPRTRTGVPIAWDNVIFDSEGLGYVVATHQALTTHQRETVLTYYHALAGPSPIADRQALLDANWMTLTQGILTDLSKPHPEIRELVRNVDIMKWGHAMIRPRPGFIWGSARQQLARSRGRIHFAHSDLSGFSIFEEAQYRGITAAEQVMTQLG